MRRRNVYAVLIGAAVLGGVVAACSMETSFQASPARVLLNPYGTAPLSAVLDIPAAVGIHRDRVHRVDVTLADPGGSTTRWSLAYGTPQYRTNYDTSDLDIPPEDIVVPLLGLAPDATTEVTVEIYEDGAARKRVVSASVTASLKSDESDPMRDGYPDISIPVPPPAEARADTTLVSFSMGHHGKFVTRPFIIDSRGVYRWVLRLGGLVDWTSPVERLANGNVILGNGRYVYEYNMLGRQVRRWDIGRYGYTQHHDIYEIKRGPRAGHLLVAVDRIGASTIEDAVIEIDRNGALLDTWDLRRVLDVSRDDLLESPKDWLHVNSVIYDPRDDSLVISGRHQGVVKVGRDKALRWILAPHQGWGKAGIRGDGPTTFAHLLNAVSPSGEPLPARVQRGHSSVDGGHAFDWPWGQHALELLANGDLLLFDNGFNRQFKHSAVGFSRAVEYRIDEHHRQVRQVWQYGADRGPDWFSDIISDVDMLPGMNHLLLTSGSVRHSANGPHAYLTEVTYPEGKVISEMRIGFRDAYCDHKPGWGNIDIVYRAERLPLYPGARQAH